MNCVDDPDKFETVPTFHPTVEEMHDFNALLASLKEKGADVVGLCKLVPPKEWNWTPKIEDARGMKVKNPIQQCVSGRSGVYRVCNIVKRDSKLGEYEVQALKKGQGAPVDFSSQQALYEAERKFWKSLTTTAAPPTYGADVEGSLFQDADVPFNVNRLDCILKQCGVKVPGITNPMMYVGMWRSFFPIHVEDVNMFSVNVMHLGAPKFWYGVPPSETKRVENLAQATWPEEKCPEMLRHKTSLFSPFRLQQAGISFVRGVQREREIMITWPSSFHTGFNAGFNVAEAVNFVPKSLLEHFFEFASNAGFCKCRPDSVVLNVDWLREQVQEKLGEKEPIDGKGQQVSNSELEPVSNPGPIRIEQVEKILSTPIDPLPRRGEVVEVRIQSSLEDVAVWLPMVAIDIVEGSVRVHEKNTSKQSDLWLDLRSDRLKRPGQEPRYTWPDKRKPKVQRSKRRLLEIPTTPVKALADYVPTETCDLAFARGQHMYTRVTEDNWWLAAYCDASGKLHRGLVPRNYVELCLDVEQARVATPPTGVVPSDEDDAKRLRLMGE